MLCCCHRLRRHSGGRRRRRRKDVLVNSTSFLLILFSISSPRLLTQSPVCHINTSPSLDVTGSLDSPHLKCVFFASNHSRSYLFFCPARLLGHEPRDPLGLCHCAGVRYSQRTDSRRMGHGHSTGVACWLRSGGGGDGDDGGGKRGVAPSPLSLPSRQECGRSCKETWSDWGGRTA